MRFVAATLLALSLTFLAVPAHAGDAVNAHDRCLPDTPCETINMVCRKLFKVDCVALDAARCMGEICDAINAVCGIVLGTPSCVG
jgi:hypothetical protein